MPIRLCVVGQVLPLSSSSIMSTHFITVSSNAHEKVVRFNVPVDKVFVMDVLDSANHLKMRKNSR